MATSRRFAVLCFGLGLFASTSAGLVAVQLQAEAAGRGGKAEWVWALPVALLVCLLPLLMFAATLSLAARDGLPASRRAVGPAAALGGVAVAAVLAAVKPLVQWLGIGGGLIGGLMLSQIGMVAAAVLAAGLLASWRPRS
jgi:hypothetical protein